MKGAESAAAVLQVMRRAVGQGSLVVEAEALLSLPWWLIPPRSVKTHTPQILGVTIHPPNLGGESSKIPCFEVFLRVIS